MEHSRSKIIGLETVTADNKNLGKVIAIDNKKKNQHHFIVLKKGVLKDEEFHIPFNSITQISDQESKITINLNEDEVKHGYEILTDSNSSYSNLISGKSNSSFSVPELSVDTLESTAIINEPPTTTNTIDDNKGKKDEKNKLTMNEKKEPLLERFPLVDLDDLKKIQLI